MATYVVFGKYTPEGMKAISAERNVEAEKLMKKFGGKMGAGYALLGEVDLVFIVEFPGTEEALQASVALSKLLGIAFTSHPAVSVDKFDKLMGEV